jgi:hypothetical protein
VHFVEAMVQGDACPGVEPDDRAAGASVHLPGGAQLEIADRHQALLAGELLRALHNPHPEPSC